ncbi:MAG: branched-chain amino acid ABC transporter permease [Clostridia bacterium]|nr:branched-chain amino acid ABC transporter permease [Clostridia bacterium]
MANEYRKELINDRSKKAKQIVSHPLFGFVILTIILAGVQLLFMFTEDIISLTVSKAIAQTLIYAIVGMGFAILLGYAGLASLGTAGFIGLGSYIAGNMLKLIPFPVPYILIIGAVIIAGIVLGGVVGFISLRIEGMYLAIITLGLSEILLELFKTPNQFTGGASGLKSVPWAKLAMFYEMDREKMFFLILGVLFITIVFTINIINSPTGRAMLAMKNSQSAAQAMGISILKYRLLAFVLATIYAMIGGALYVTYLRASNTSSWTLALSLNVLAAVIIGGYRSVWGVLMGTFVIFGLDLAVLKNIDFFNKYPGSSAIFSGVLIVLIVMFYPGGLIRLFADIKTLIKSGIEKWKVYRYGKDYK